MKFVKLSIVALSLGLFVASCGESATEEAPAADTVSQTTTTVVEETPAPAADATAPVDTTVKTETTTTTTEATPATH